MHKWYVLQVYSAQEKKVKQALEEHKELKGIGDLLEKVLLPIENVSEVKNGQQRVVEKRLWPGYLLVKMNLTDESWHYVKATPGVIEFLGGDKPTALTDKEVEEILYDLENKKQKITQKHKFEVGDKVKITDGVFVNFMGTVQEVFHDKGRLSVLVSIFGRETRVDDLEFIQVEEIIEDAETL
ncbi:MAG TPA: transcription termination/antitermination protein NusG [Parachlamydiaceae bacterium]|nr:transcription termination/antitermination protein NusG [Parachlamydiaceae bacterium]